MPPGGRYPAYVLGVLVVVYVFNFPTIALQSTWLGAGASGA